MSYTETGMTTEVRTYTQPDAEPKSVRTLKLAVRVEGEDRLRDQRSSRANYFRPERAQVEVVNGAVTDVFVAGPKLKVDGSDGVMDGEKRWYSVAWREREPGSAPEWLEALAAEAVQRAQDVLESPAPAQSTPEAVAADTEALEAAGVPVRANGLRKDADGHVVLPESWKTQSPDSVARDLRTFATRLQGLAADLDHAVAVHSLADGSYETLVGITDQLEVTRDGMDATVQGLEGLAPTVLNLWLELTYGSEFARKFRKASRMVRDDLR